MLDRVRPTLSKNSSSSLKRLRSTPYFPTMFIIFLFAPFKRSSHNLTKAMPSFVSILRFLLLCSTPNNPLLHSNVLRLISAIPF